MAGRDRSRPAYAGTLAFYFFAGISFYLGWIGVATCGCFGAIKASPWHAFGVDVVAVLLLAGLRPNLLLGVTVTSSEFRHEAVAGIGYLTGIAGLMAALTGAAALAYGGSPEAAMARLRGEQVTAQPTYLDFGIAEPSQVVAGTIEVKNWSRRPVRLIGGTSDCSCVTTDGLPCHISPGETVALAVQLKMPAGGRGAFVRKAEIWWTNSDKQKTIRLLVGGRVK